MLVIAYSQNAFPIDNSLNEFENQRASAFQFESLREQYTFAHSFKRKVLSHYYPLKSPDAWRFDQTRFGKPFVEDPVAFNLSHSKASVALAVISSANKNSVGVDIETFKDMDDLDSMIEMVCHPDEIQCLNKGVDRVQCFFKLWTAKEALLKACGSGLIEDLSRINCQQSISADQVYLLSWLGKQYCLRSFSFTWGVITTAWLADLSVSRIRLDDWTSGVPESDLFFCDDYG